MGRRVRIGVAAVVIALCAAGAPGPVLGGSPCSDAIDAVQAGQLADARELVAAFDTRNPELRSCKQTVEQLAEEREQRAEAQLQRAMDASLPDENRIEALAEALTLNADLADDATVIELDAALNPPTPAGPCDIANELLDTDLDGAESIFTQLSSASDAELKKCGERGLAQVAAARVAAQKVAGTERAERWWDDMVDDFLAPIVEIVGGILAVALVVAALVKLMSAFMTVRRVRPMVGTVAVVVTGVLAIVLNVILAGADIVRNGLPGLVAVGLFGATVVAVGLAATPTGRGDSERRIAILSGIAAVATAIIWIQDLISDRQTDWWNVVLLGAVGIAGLASLVIAQAARARLVIDPVDASSEAIGKEFAWLVRERFLAIGSGPPRGLELVVGTDQTDLPADSVGEIAPNAVISALLKVARAFTPTATYRLTGQLHEQDGSDNTKVPTSLTVSLKATFRTPSMTHIDSSLFNIDEQPDGEVRRQLATAGAAWLLVQLLDQPGSRPQIGGASSWQSVALQSIASEGSDDRRRQALFARSVDFDNQNLAARLGRATTASRVASAIATGEDADGDAVQEARRGHEFAIAELDDLERRGEAESLNAALRVRMAYNASAQRLQLAELVNDDSRREELLDDARSRLAWLLETILVADANRTVDELGHRFTQRRPGSRPPSLPAPPTPVYQLSGADRRELASFLRSLKSTVYYAWLSSEVLARRLDRGPEIPPGTDEELQRWHIARTTPRAAYNYACAASHGRSSFDVRSFEPLTVATGLQREDEERKVVEANVALALEFLRIAVHDPQHRSWAQADPSLKFARDNSEAIRKLIAGPTPADEKPNDPETHIVLLGTAPEQKP